MFVISLSTLCCVGIIILGAAQSLCKHKEIHVCRVLCYQHVVFIQASLFHRVTYYAEFLPKKARGVCITILEVSSGQHDVLNIKCGNISLVYERVAISHK